MRRGLNAPDGFQGELLPEKVEAKPESFRLGQAKKSAVSSIQQLGHVLVFLPRARVDKQTKAQTRVRACT